MLVFKLPHQLASPFQVADNTVCNIDDENSYIINALCFMKPLSQALLLLELFCR